VHRHRAVGNLDLLDPDLDLEAPGLGQGSLPEGVEVVGFLDVRAVADELLEWQIDKGHDRSLGLTSRQAPTVTNEHRVACSGCQRAVTS
jgi:hypothetical protein